MDPLPRKKPQISLGVMLLLNIIFCVLAGALYWASRVPVIADEIAMMLGGRGGGGGNDRAVHMIFLMFLYTAPLLLAGILATLLTIWRRMATTGTVEEEPVVDPFAELDQREPQQR